MCECTHNNKRSLKLLCSIPGIAVLLAVQQGAGRLLFWSRVNTPMSECDVKPCNMYQTGENCSCKSSLNGNVYQPSHSPTLISLKTVNKLRPTNVNIICIDSRPSSVLSATQQSVEFISNLSELYHSSSQRFSGLHLAAPSVMIINVKDNIHKKIDKIYK